ncbi:MAG: methyltransferase domain-containing protein [Candidatus Methanoperedens sp.]|nr:methyltransferase domain-containing protein [Candidatus Methanoperedens sp.]MCZ7369840.1 methyltransferase domain-containing protein [Candidatus Methanoperedens sp.]
MDKIALKVNRFYERYPYPCLPIRNHKDLVNKLHANVMSRILATAKLNPGLLKGMEILDAGCGTGEKACYFSYHGAHVTAIDLCKASLQKARELADKFNLVVEFHHCDLAEFRTEKRFDHVFCLGALHHTKNPYDNFAALADLCKVGGTITIGLYNLYGRLGHRTVRMWVGLRAGEDLGRRMDYVERAIYGRKLRSLHEVAYVADKYVHPHESYHTVGEVLGWFEKKDISFIGAHPHTGTGSASALMTQLKWMFRGNGFFVISGRKN